MELSAQRKDRKVTLSSKFCILTSEDWEDKITFAVPDVGNEKKDFEAWLPVARPKTH